MSVVPFPPAEEPAEEEPVILYDEDGQAAAFDFLDTVDRGEKQYIVLAPRAGGDSVTIMEMVPDPAEADSYIFYPVADNKTLQSVFRAFRRQNGLA